MDWNTQGSDDILDMIDIGSVSLLKVVSAENTGLVEKKNDG